MVLHHLAILSVEPLPGRITYYKAGQAITKNEKGDLARAVYGKWPLDFAPRKPAHSGRPIPLELIMQI